MRRLLFALAGLAVLAGTLPTHGQQAGSEMNAEFQVTPVAGEWLILAASYTGPKAPQMTHDLIVHVRQEHKLPAYAFNRGKEEKQKQWDEYQNARERVPDLPFRGFRIEEQFAVLIGGYKDMESARKALDEVRKFKAPPQDLMDRVAIAGGGNKEDKKTPVEAAFISPFKTAFVVRNPTVKAPALAPEPPDPFIKQLNAGESYSLFKCKKPWTLAVKDFTGGFTVENQRTESSPFLEKIGLSKGPDRLTASAVQAHELARVLHDYMHLEAYVLHTRHLSVVCVGGFSTPNDPELLRTKDQLAKLQFRGASPASGSPQSQAQCPWELWPQPMLMEVPKH